MTIDFSALAAKLLADAPALLSQWLPAGKLNGREYKCGNLQGDAGQSLSINIDTGIGKDFATGETFGDLIDLYSQIHGIKQIEAAKQLGGDEIKQPDVFITGEECHPIPKHKHGKPAGVFEYRKENGELYGYVCRFEPLNQKKQFAPLTCWQTPDGKKKWQWKKWPITSLPYRIEEAIANPAAKVLLVEGEKKAHVAQALLPDWIVLGWCGGAEAVNKTDWKALLTRYCWIWPDNNLPGIKAAKTLKGILSDLHIVDLSQVTINGEPLPDGWDLGNADDDFEVEKYLATPLIIQQIQTVEIPNNRGKLIHVLELLNIEYAVILRGSQVLIMRYWTGSDGKSNLVFLTKRDFLLLQENNIIFLPDSDGNKKPIRIGQAWLEWMERKSYEEVYFEPRGREYPNRFNLWRGFAVAQRKGDRFNLFLDHIRHNICDGNNEHYEWVMAWIADMFQRPGRKLGTALILRGAMGIGKGQFAHHLGKLLGVNYMPITQPSQLTGKFNGHLFNKLLMFVDEGWWSDERTGAGILRALITEPEITIEMKGRDAVTNPNFTRFIIATNDDWVVEAGMGDERRYTILDVGEKEMGNKDYFNAIDEQLTNIRTVDGEKYIIDEKIPVNIGYMELLDYFLNYQYDDKIPRTILKTDALCENKIYSMSDELKWWQECLTREKIGDFVLSDTLDRFNDIPCDIFHAHYIAWCKQMLIKPLSANILPKKLKPAVVNFNRKQITTTLSGNKEWHYCLQTLSDMKAHFENFIGHKLDWNEI